MQRILIVGLVVILFGAAAANLYIIERIEKLDPMGKELLYLPTPEFLRAISLGNTGVVADVLYLWAIQYYSQFKPNTQFLYLDSILLLINELDPLYEDPYRIGAIIMGIESEGNRDLRKESVKELYDRALRNNPSNYQIALDAAWNFWINYNDQKLATYYAEIASKIPTASDVAKRAFVQLAFESNTITLDQAIECWKTIASQAKSEYHRAISRNTLYDLIARRDKKSLQKYIDDYKKIYAVCPASWQQIIQSKISIDGKQLRMPPIDFYGNEYGIAVETCQVVAFKKIKED